MTLKLSLEIYAGGNGFIALILTYSRSAWLCCLFSLAFHVANFKFIKNLKVILSIIFACFAIFFLFKDIFFEQNFKFMMGYSDKTKNISSEKSVLDFHLMHINYEEFFYKPNENTPKFIWRYLSNYNLLEQISEIDLEDVQNI